MPDNIFIIYTDGGSRSNPGIAGAGVVIQDATGSVLKKITKPLGVRTNNWAEYEAVITGLKALQEIVPKAKRKETRVEVRSDSELVVKQLNGDYQLKEETLFPQFIKIWNIRVAEFPNITFTHIRREENTEADRLANQAMDEQTGAGAQGRLSG